MLRVLLVLGLLFGGGCASFQCDKSPLSRFEFEEPQMGVPFRMVIYALDQAAAERAADAAFARVARLNAIMSDYETDSEISRLSRSSEEGAPEVALSDDLWKVLSNGQKLAELSGGAFDMTIGPCAALWRKARREQEFPDAARLQNALSKVGHRNLLLNASNRTARLARFGMRLDLGAIAKGYAADEALETLRQHGIPVALVAASGDLAIGEAPPGAKGWRVELAGYDAANGPAAKVVHLANCGVATSGDLFQRLEINGIRYSHILNPFTGVGMTNHALATVIARDCMTADMLDTTFTILPAKESFALADRYRVAARIVQMEKETPVSRENRRFRRMVASD